MLLSFTTLTIIIDPRGSLNKKITQKYARGVSEEQKQIGTCKVDFQMSCKGFRDTVRSMLSDKQVASGESSKSLSSVTVFLQSQIIPATVDI